MFSADIFCMKKLIHTELKNKQRVKRVLPVLMNAKDNASKDSFKTRYIIIVTF